MSLPLQQRLVEGHLENVVNFNFPREETKPKQREKQRSPNVRFLG